MHELDVLPLRDPDAAALLAPVPEEARDASWLLAEPDGSLHGFGAGIPRLLGAIRLTRPLGRLLSPLPDGALDAGYGLVARNRGRLGRLVPDGPAPRRRPAIVAGEPVPPTGEDR
jgi:predicted DCC family thiol-disulfide oxidoreductase YuxK